MCFIFPNKISCFEFFARERSMFFSFWNYDWSCADMEQMVLSTSRVSGATSVQLKARGTTSFKNTNSRKQTSTTKKKKKTTSCMVHLESSIWCSESKCMAKMENQQTWTLMNSSCNFKWPALCRFSQFYTLTFKCALSSAKAYPADF